jgi:hypothetical protein
MSGSVASGTPFIIFVLFYADFSWLPNIMLRVQIRQTKSPYLVWTEKHGEDSSL